MSTPACLTVPHLESLCPPQPACQSLILTLYVHPSLPASPSSGLSMSTPACLPVPHLDSLCPPQPACQSLILTLYVHPSLPASTHFDSICPPQPACQSLILTLYVHPSLPPVLFKHVCSIRYTMVAIFISAKKSTKSRT